MPRSKLAIVLRIVTALATFLVAVVVVTLIVASFRFPADPFGDSPEGAVRSLLLAISLHDGERIREFAMPDAGLDWLRKGDADLGKPAVALQRSYAALPIRRLQAGDEVRLPGGRVVTVTPAEVAEGHAVIWPEKFPVPFRCHRVAGRWRVDASGLIAARKAAAAVAERDAARKAAAQGR
jgi:hypothetical protein